jgi:membrane-bound lytic murein transglycosylase A
MTRHLRAVLSLALAGVLAGCALFTPAPPGIGKAVAWSELPGWSADRHAQAWPALLQSCQRRGSEPDWGTLCRAAQALSLPDDATARRFFETWFVPHRLHAQDGGREGLMTGYYVPVLDGSPVQTPRFRYPIYERPADLLTVDLGALYPELRGKRVRGRLEGGRVIPYYSRAEIEQQSLPAPVLAWVDDPVALFFLQVQGSGRIRMPGGRLLHVGYADQNGHPYVAVGRCLVERGALKLEEVNLASIRAWLQDHPEQADAMLHCNPSYVFFTAREGNGAAIGALNVPLTAQRSAAVDPSYIPLGAPLWVDTTLPGETVPYRRLMLAQDTGGAIRGPVRADLFWGEGEEAERMAGMMKQRGRLFLLQPRAHVNAQAGLR